LAAAGEGPVQRACVLLQGPCGGRSPADPAVLRCCGRRSPPCLLVLTGATIL